MSWEPRNEEPRRSGALAVITTRLAGSDATATGEEAQAEETETEHAQHRRLRNAGVTIAPRFQMRDTEQEVTAVRLDLDVQVAVLEQAGHNEVEHREVVDLRIVDNLPGAAVEAEPGRFLTVTEQVPGQITADRIVRQQDAEASMADRVLA